MSSVILGAFALGSALSAIVFGTRKFTGSIARRFVWCALAMFVLEVPRAVHRRACGGSPR